jgi:S-formylglutathione hydrolase FrmB
MALIECNFYSHVLGLSCTMSVILPGPAAPSAVPPAPPFPTLYLLHGLSDDHTTWQRRTSIERYVEQRRLAVVMPAVHRGFYTDMAAGGRYWTFISEEVPAVARMYFPLSDRREDNYAAGLSMGGYGAFKLALTYPERYAAAASLSGAVDVVRLHRAEVAAGGREYQRIFGPEAALAGSPNDLFHLAEQLAQRPRPWPALYQWCGTGDGLYEDNVRFHRHLDRLGIPITYSDGPGLHEWAYWDAQIQQVLDWLPSADSGPRPAAHG